MRLPLLALAAVLAAPTWARAEEGAGPNPDIPAAAAPSAAPRSGRLPRWGAALGAGFPDFATAEVVYRPVPYLRLRAGPAWNTVGWGLQGGIEVAPWSWAVSPLLSVHGGKFLRSDYSSFVEDDDEARPLFERVDYAYAAVDLGLDFGNRRGFSVALRLGLAFVSAASRGTATYASDGGAAVTLARPSLAATLPSAKLALQYWF